MKVLIDIPQEMFKATQTYYSDNTTRLSIKSCIEKIANGTPISEEVTNGDMIQNTFPNIPVNIFEDMNTVIFGNAQFDLDWWSAPYKNEGGGK